MDKIWDTYDQNGCDLLGPTELRDFLKDLLTNVIENRKVIRERQDEASDHDHKFTEDSEDEEYQKQISSDFSLDFERIYALFDPDFLPKSSPGDLPNPDKIYDGRITKNQMKVFLQVMLLPDDSED